MNEAHLKVKRTQSRLKKSKYVSIIEESTIWNIQRQLCCKEKLSSAEVSVLSMQSQPTDTKAGESHCFDGCLMKAVFWQVLMLWLLIDAFWKIKNLKLWSENKTLSLEFCIWSETTLQRTNQEKECLHLISYVILLSSIWLRQIKLLCSGCRFRFWVMVNSTVLYIL